MKRIPNGLERYYSKRINYCYMLEQCAINFKIPLVPLFQRGRPLFPLFGKEGLGEIRMNVRMHSYEHTHFIELELMRLY
jgi:hypothetical protein